ncbi:hypothetical protein NBRGN_045_01030 [Nocardia brasiliensis NBRC 14402]|uniref:hypothetical protein n=1 Tax=Nocardia brasiliensis TaxID=37326 RepID=UPI0002E64204|nr:hypothetical protein [Nocardia brasiliensis]ASF09890.1 hypothetical protein CEQ30_23850 [Nocardia brasiliensis]GAJ82001.1 hypothetical protein NBRGN_045_01030 [Nocardia brasiliensis NBRC 14402]SUB55025.1 Uncharacterised protein [Nocardia brasiliensis]
MTSPNTLGPHLSDDQLIGVPDDAARAHLRACAECQAHAQIWQQMAVAARQVSADLVGAARTPSFDALLGDALGMPWATTNEAVRPGWRASLLLTVTLARAQLRLLPRALVLLSALGFVGSVLLAVLTRHSGAAAPLFGLTVTLLFQLGTLATCMPRSDPRLELFATLPIAPAAVFACRLIVVLAADLALALLASLLASGVGASADFGATVAGWLGPALLASAVGVAGAVWRSPPVGAGAGAVMWLLGAAATADAGPAHRVGAVIAPLWSTSVLTLAVAALLLVAAAAGMSRPRYRTVAG